VLGPILFLLFINDLPNYLVSMFKMYDRPARLGHLQTSLGHISTWCDMWQLRMSNTKCSVLHMGRPNPRFDYEINNTTLPTSCCVKDLGIQIDDTLSFSLQYSSMVSKARSCCALFLHSFVGRDPTLTIGSGPTLMINFLESIYDHLWNKVTKFGRQLNQCKLMK